MQRRSFIKGAAGLGAASMLRPAGAAFAQRTYPDRPVTIVAATAAGTSTDIAIRLVAAGLQAKLGQPFVVANAPGAAGLVGAQRAANSAADGYTLVASISGFFASSPQLTVGNSFNPLKELTPVARVADQYTVLYTRKDSPYQTVQQLIEAAKKAPETITFATTGVNGEAHIHAELFSLLAGIKMIHVPYPGGRYVPDLVTGRVDIASGGSAAYLSSRGEMKGLLIGAKSHSVLAPELPTPKDVGLPEYEIPVSIVFLGPAGLPQPVLDTLDKAFGEVVAQPDIRQKLLAIGLEPNFQGSAAFGKSFVELYNLMTDIIKRAGLKPA